MSALPRALAALAVVLCIGLAAGAESARAQAAVALDYSVVDRATVRVFSVHGVGTARLSTSSGRHRLLAIPESSHGSGLLVSADGLIVTARHVVERGSVLAVWVPGHDTAFEARVVHIDEHWDLAVLVIQGTFGDFVPLAALGRALRVREQVNAIGYPLDVTRVDPQSAQGIVAGVLPSGELQLDIGVNPGNSGGPLIDADEHVVGMVVARGDVEQGVQSIGVAVPVDPIVSVLATLDPSAGELATARLSLTNQAHGAEVAELVRILVRVRGTELFADVERALDGRGTGEVLARLRRFAESAHDAETMALLAAYFWDAAALALERNGGALMASELAAGPDRDLAADLLGRAVRLCFAARRSDPAIVSRSPFVAWVTHYLREPSAAPTTTHAPAPPSSAATPPHPPVARAPAVREPRTPEQLVRERDHRLHVWTDILLGVSGPQSNVSGVLTRLGLAASPYTLRAGPFAFDLWLGASAGVDYNGATLLRTTRVALALDIGGSIRIGDASGFVLAGAWSPSVLFPIGAAPAGALGSGRLHVGAQIGSFQLGLEWHGLQVEGDFVIHGLGLHFDWGFLQ